MHHTEKDKSTNTARLVKLLIPDSELRIVGERSGTPDIHSLIAPDTDPFVLFPDPSAAVLAEEFMAGRTRPLTLIVPDGTWKQARKLTNRQEAFRGIPRLRLPPGPPSRYALRRNQREGSVCTMEAIARALGFIENHEVQEQLERYLDLMVDRVLWSRSTSQLFEDATVWS